MDGYILKSGSGGSGDNAFAIIKILYDPGEEIEVEFDSQTYEAPDTSGVWLFNCEGIGTYTVKLLGEYAQEETVEITTRGQVEIVPITYHQVVNYMLVAKQGSAGKWSCEFINGSAYFCENLARDLSDYSICFINQYQRIETNRRSNLCWNNAYKNDYSTIKGTLITSSAINKSYVMQEVDTSELTNVYLKIRFEGNNSNNQKGNFWVSRDGGPKLEVVCAGFAKHDDISGLELYGHTIQEILANSNQLFNSPAMITYISRKCTGDFMLSALNNSTFITAMNNSENKSILLANNHWSKFIGYIS